MLRRYNILSQCKATYCINAAEIKTKHTIQLDPNVSKLLDNADIKPKHHPGISKIKCVTLPNTIIKSAIKLIKDYPVKSIILDSEKLHRYLLARHPPIEENDFFEKRRSIYKELEDDSALDADKKKILADQTKKILGQRIYNWQPIAYDEYKAIQYLIKRSPAEYAVIHKIMSEILQRDLKFKPHSFLDFGSGVGTGVWVASDLWKNSIYEYVLVDSSRHMNDLSDMILRNGDSNRSLGLKNVYFRQFLPANSPKYDIVLSGYSMLELPSLKARSDVLLNLWSKCDKYLILIEMGSKVGFNIINEAREIIINHAKETGEDVEIFSPCSHSLTCPRFTLNDGTPCNFEISYNPIPVFGQNTDITQELYSYVVLRRGKSDDVTMQWPRVVRPTIVRHKHTICRMCTKQGDLKEVIFTSSKQGSLAYKCAKATRWGDRIPIDFL